MPAPRKSLPPPVHPSSDYVSSVPTYGTAVDGGPPETPALPPRRASRRSEAVGRGALAGAIGLAVVAGLLAGSAKLSSLGDERIHELLARQLAGDEPQQLPGFGGGGCLLDWNPRTGELERR